MNLSDCFLPIEGKDAARTAARAQRLVAHWDPDLDTYTPLAAQEALSKWSGSTFNRYRSSLGLLLRGYRMHGGPRLELPPMQKEGRPRDRILTPQEEWALVSSPVGDLALVLLATAMRISEVYRAYPLDTSVHSKAPVSLLEATGSSTGGLGHVENPMALRELGALVLEDTKNGDRRVIPVVPEVMQAFQRLRLPPERTLRRLWNKHSPVTPHVCRHTAITRWAEAGLSLPEIKALAGHRSTETTLRYMHLTTEHLSKRISSLPLPGAQPVV